MMDDKTVQQFLVKLGLDDFEAKIYLTLVRRGILTPLELSRITGIDRAKIYRRLEDMQRRGLVEEVIDEKRRMARAVDFERLEELLRAKEEGTKLMREKFPELMTFLNAQVGKSDPETRVLFYRGKSGLKQMIWNNLRAENEVVGYTYRQVLEFVGLSFINKWNDEFQRRGLHFRHVYSDYYIRSTKELKKKSDYSDKFFEGRYVSKKVLNIDHQVDIYNDVVAYYNWHEGDVFGVEIYNRKIARMQKQLFEMVWEKAVNSKP